MSFAARVVRPASTAYFSPSQVANSGWWIADDPSNSLTGDIINSWTDKSGSGNTLTPWNGETGRRGRLISNFLGGRGVSRGQTSDSLRGQYIWGNLGMSNNVTGMTMFIVHKHITDTGSTDAPMMSIDVGGIGNGRIYMGRGSFSSGAVYGGGRRLDSDGGIWAQDTTNYSNNWLIVCITNDYATGYARLSVNGQVTNNTFGSTGSTSATNSYAHSFGHQNTNSQDSYIAEGIVRVGFTPDALRQKFEGYLAWQYGLQTNLVSGHPYRTVQPPA